MIPREISQEAIALINADDDTAVTAFMERSSVHYEAVIEWLKIRRSIDESEPSEIELITKALEEGALLVPLLDRHK